MWKQKHLTVVDKLRLFLNIEHLEASDYGIFSEIYSKLNAHNVRWILKPRGNIGHVLFCEISSSGNLMTLTCLLLVLSQTTSAFRQKWNSTTKQINPKNHKNLKPLFCYLLLLYIMSLCCFLLSRNSCVTRYCNYGTLNLLQLQSTPYCSSVSDLPHFPEWLYQSPQKCSQRTIFTCLCSV